MTKVQLEFLVLVVHKDPRVKLDHVDLEEALVKRENQETKAFLVLQDVMVFQGPEDSQVHPALLECLEKMEIKENKDHQEKRALREAKVILVQMVLLDHRAFVVPQVHQEHQVSVDHQVFWDELEEKGKMDLKVLLVLLGQLEYRVFLGHLVTRGQRVTLDLVVSLVLLVPLVRLVNREVREDLGYQDQLDLMDCRVRKVNPDNLVYLDLLARMVNMEN